MTGEAHQKVTTAHLKRNAYLYVRQSTIRQVLENTESTKRQYALQQRAIGLGWAVEQIVVIDSDLGQSGASAADREGFQRLVADVGMGKAGIVLGLEVSRKQGLLFPRRPRHGLHKGDLLWVELTHSRAIQVLHNPRYAGAFAYGRHRNRKTVDGKGTCHLLPPDQWILLQNAHAGYI